MHFSHDKLGRNAVEQSTPHDPKRRWIQVGK